MNGPGSPSTRIALYAGSSIALLVIWLMIFFVPARAKRANQLLNIQTAGGELTQLQSTLQALPTYLAALDSTTKARVTLAQKLYTPAELPRLLEDIHKLATQENLKVDELHPPLDEFLVFASRISANPDSSVLSIRVVLNGRYHAYGRFLKQLEDRAYFRAMTAQQMATDIDKSPDLLRIEIVCRVLMSQPERSFQAGKA